MPLQNALLNMDEKGDDVLGMDDTPEEEGKEQGTSGHDVQKPGQEKALPKKRRQKKKLRMSPCHIR